MHDEHDHAHHDHHHHIDAAAEHGPGHNRRAPLRRAAQWQVAHRDEPQVDQPAGEPDVDLVEAAFIEAFATASDLTSLLRLAQVPFEVRAADDAKLCLLRVETEAIADIGSVMPHLGGATFRYDPLPAALVARRSRLRFVYFDGKDMRVLTLAEVRALEAR